MWWNFLSQYEIYKGNIRWITWGTRPIPYCFSDFPIFYNGIISYFIYIFHPPSTYRADFRLAPIQWETSSQCNAVSHWLSANLESALHLYCHPIILSQIVSVSALNVFASLGWRANITRSPFTKVVVKRTTFPTLLFPNAIEVTMNDMNKTYWHQTQRNTAKH